MAPTPPPLPGELAGLGEGRAAQAAAQLHLPRINKGIPSPAELLDRLLWGSPQAEPHGKKALRGGCCPEVDTVGPVGRMGWGQSYHQPVGGWRPLSLGGAAADK